MTKLSEATERHKTAKTAWDKRPDETEETTDPLFAAERQALHELVVIPCASDAEFIAKLRYIFAHEMEVEGGSYLGDAFATVLEAIDVHLNGEARL